jgi:hypothetical protein
MTFRTSALAALLALACALSACGGGTTDPADASVAAAQAKVAAQKAAKQATASANGATLTGTTGTLVDSAGNVWSLKSSRNNGLQVTKNGALAGTSIDVITLLYYNGVIWQENVQDNWWDWVNNTWAGGNGLPDPRGSGGGTTPPPPPPPPSTGSVAFYGVNGHYEQGGIYASNISQQVKDMQAMGVGTIRQDCYSTSDTADMANLISQFAPVNIQPIFNVYPTTTNETTAYNQFYAYGVTVAGQLAGKVPVIELQNEPENQYFPQAPSGNGQSVTNWSAGNQYWAAYRGSVRGFIDGFRSVDTTKQTLIASPSVGWLHYGLLEGLWNGTAPDGSSGHPTARWDITNYHWYYDMGDIENAGGVNTLSVLQAQFGVPILLTEIGVQSSVSSSTYNSYVATAIAEYAGAAAKTYDIIGVDWYELYNFDNNGGFYMGLYTQPGTANGTRAAAMTTAISSNSPQ